MFATFLKYVAVKLLPSVREAPWAAGENVWLAVLPCRLQPGGAPPRSCPSISHQQQQGQPSRSFALRGFQHLPVKDVCLIPCLCSGCVYPSPLGDHCLLRHKVAPVGNQSLHAVTPSRNLSGWQASLNGSFGFFTQINKSHSSSSCVTCTVYSTIPHC